jgi:hypothetical protein
MKSMAGAGAVLAADVAMARAAMMKSFLSILYPPLP